MRFGVSAGIDDAAMLKDAGFDFLEVNVQGVLQGQVASKEWLAAAPNLEKIALPIEAANCLVPGGLPIVGPKRDMAALQDYLQRVAKRAQHLGIQRLVFGSGGARRRPKGVSKARAFEQIAEFTALAGEIAAHHGVMIVIEHLNRGETNTINSLEEAGALCDHVSHPSVAVLVDSYHFGKEEESDEALLALGDRIRHVHVAEVVDRIEPGGHGELPQAFDFDNFFCLLRKIGYDERVSIEAGWSGEPAASAAKSAAFLRQAWLAAGRCESR